MQVNIYLKSVNGFRVNLTLNNDQTVRTGSGKEFQSKNGRCKVAGKKKCFAPVCESFSANCREQK